MTHGAETRRFRATIAYDGTGYHGFQRQKNASPTIQAALETALASITRQAVDIIGAGRTDAGVHAQAQVIAFNIQWGHAPQDLENALNATLPEEIRVRNVAPTQADFHPRYNARSRTYCYRLWQAPVQDPLKRYNQWHIQRALDLQAISSAVAMLPGERNFGTFGRPPLGKNTRRTVKVATWTATYMPDHEACVHEFVIEANAFLYRMVRSLVGTLHEVGVGRLTPAEFGEALSAAQRSYAGPTAPPHGLTLIAVNY